MKLRGLVAYGPRGQQCQLPAGVPVAHLELHDSAFSGGVAARA